MALAMRSFTEADGLKLSNLARISAWQPQAWGNRFNRTRGVPPIKAVMSGAMLMAAACPQNDHKKSPPQGRAWDVCV
jgi:hypothetical protein